MNTPTLRYSFSQSDFREVNLRLYVASHGAITHTCIW